MPPEPPVTLSCPGCGRVYDAGRFARGRTLDCACGARVGQCWETGALTNLGAPRFFVDSMLGGLARWLRVLGYDAAWEAGIADDELVRRGGEEGRLVLTRDRRLVSEWWADNLLLLTGETPLDQLREVADRIPISRGGLFTRCTRCNLPLQPTEPECVAAHVPHDVRERRAGLARCPACERVYWEGSHTERMRRALEKTGVT